MTTTVYVIRRVETTGGWQYGLQRLGDFQDFSLTETNALVVESEPSFTARQAQEEDVSLESRKVREDLYEVTATWQNDANTTGRGYVKVKSSG